MLDDYLEHYKSNKKKMALQIMNSMNQFANFEHIAELLLYANTFKLMWPPNVAHGILTLLQNLNMSGTAP